MAEILKGVGAELTLPALLGDLIRRFFMDILGIHFGPKAAVGSDGVPYADPEHKRDRMDERALAHTVLLIARKDKALAAVFRKVMQKLLDKDLLHLGLTFLEAVTDLALVNSVRDPGGHKTNPYLVVRKIGKKSTETTERVMGKGPDAKKVPMLKVIEDETEIILPNLDNDANYTAIVDQMIDGIQLCGGASANPDDVLEWIRENGFIARSHWIDMMRNLRNKGLINIVKGICTLLGIDKLPALSEKALTASQANLKTAKDSWTAALAAARKP